MLSEKQHAAVAAAIKAAEAGTSGEIHCVVCRQSDPYFMAAAFVLSSVALVLGFAYSWLFHWLWIDIEPSILTGTQLAAWALGLAVLWWFPALRLRMVAKRVRYRRAHANALQQFLARNIHVTEARTGVLIFVSLAERYAEVVADSGIAAKVDQEQWNDIVGKIIVGAKADRLADALVEAVDDAGGLLAQHFPPGADDKNELPDHVVEM